jgi:hypothetical protein
MGVREREEERASSITGVYSSHMLNVTTREEGGRNDLEQGKRVRNAQCAKQI